MKAVALAEGQAVANRRLTESLSPQVIQWRQLDIAERALEKWNGVLPQSLLGTGEGNGLMFSLPGTHK